MAMLMLVGPKCCWDIVRIESCSVNVMKGKFWCMLLWLCLPAANVKKGYSQVGNELLHEAGSPWIV